MTTETILSIFQIYSSHLPVDWATLRIFYKFNQDSSMSFVDYINNEGVTIKPPLWLNGSETVQLNELIEGLAAKLNLGEGAVTHLELLLHNDGNFKTRLGYGSIDWDNIWPDDITTETYTYEERGAAY